MLSSVQDSTDPRRPHLARSDIIAAFSSCDPLCANDFGRLRAASSRIAGNLFTFTIARRFKGQCQPDCCNIPYHLLKPKKAKEKRSLVNRVPPVREIT